MSVLDKRNPAFTTITFSNGRSCCHMMIMINDRRGGTPRAFATSKHFASLVPRPAQSMQKGISTPTFYVTTGLKITWRPVLKRVRMTCWGNGSFDRKGSEAPGLSPDDRGWGQWRPGSQAGQHASCLSNSGI